MAARGTTRSRMSLAPLALAFQNAFSRASMSAAPESRGSTYTSRAPSSVTSSASSPVSSSTRSSLRFSSTTTR